MDEDNSKKKPIYERHPRSPRSYKYYDTPDGQDLLPKLLYTTKCGAFLGMLYGGSLALTKYPPPKRSIFIWIDAVRRAIPFVLFPIVYTTTTYSVTNFRQKDEVLNANIGGAVAGFTTGVWYKNAWIAMLGALCGAYLCGLKKETVQKGIQFPAPDPPRLVETSWMLRNLDFTLTKDIPDFEPKF